jgi:hypothetical protein
MDKTNLSFDEPFFQGQEVVFGDWWGGIHFGIITKNLLETWDRGMLPLSYIQSPEIFLEWENKRCR